MNQNIIEKFNDLLGEEKTETKGSEKEVLGDQVEAAMERLVSDTVGHIPMPEIDDEDDDYDDYEDDDEEYIPQAVRYGVVNLGLILAVVKAGDFHTVDDKSRVSAVISAGEYVRVLKLRDIH